MLELPSYTCPNRPEDRSELPPWSWAPGIGSIKADVRLRGTSVSGRPEYAWSWCQVPGQPPPPRNVSTVHSRPQKIPGVQTWPAPPKCVGYQSPGMEEIESGCWPLAWFSGWVPALPPCWHQTPLHCQGLAEELKPRCLGLGRLFRQASCLVV